MKLWEPDMDQHWVRLLWNINDIAANNNQIISKSWNNYIELDKVNIWGELKTMHHLSILPLFVLVVAVHAMVSF